MLKWCTLFHQKKCISAVEEDVNRGSWTTFGSSGPCTKFLVFMSHVKPLQRILETSSVLPIHFLMGIRRPCSYFYAPFGFRLWDLLYSIQIIREAVKTEDRAWGLAIISGNRSTLEILVKGLITVSVALKPIEEPQSMPSWTPTCRNSCIRCVGNLVQEN